MARKVLRQLQAEQPDLTIEEVDIAAAPLQAWREGIRMIPAIKAGDQTLSGVFLDKQKISAFLAKVRPS